MADVGKDPRKNDTDPDAADADDLAKAMKAKSCGLIPATNPLRKACIWLSGKKLFGNFILVLIMINCIILAFQTPTAGPSVKCSVAPSPDEYNKHTHNCGAKAGETTCNECQRLGYCSCNGPLDAVALGSFVWAERAGDVEIYFTIMFSLEAVVKIIASGFIRHPGAYLRNGWNWLDWVVVVMSWVSMLPGVENFSAIRTVRVLRPLRTMSRIPGMGVIVGAMLKSLRPLSNVMLLCGVVFFVFGILGIQFWYNMPKSHCGADMLYYNDLAAWRPAVELSGTAESPVYTNFRCHSLNTLLPVDGGQSCAFDQFDDPPATATALTADQCIGVKGAKETHFFKGVNFEELSNSLNTFIENADVYTPPNSQGIDTSATATLDLVPSSSSDYDFKALPTESLLYNYNLQGAGCACGQVCTSALYFYCDSMGAISFDNIGTTMMAIFQSVTLEGWTDIMYRTDELENPIRGGGWVYFIMLIFFAGLFVVNLALAVIAESYGEATDEEETREAEMEEERHKEEEKESQEKLVGGPPVAPKGVCKKRCVKAMKRSKKTRDLVIITKLRELVDSMNFTWFVMIFIGVNTFMLACDSHNDALCTAMEMKVTDIYDPVPVGLKAGELNGPCMPTELTKLLELGNIILTVFFAFEMVLKMVALGFMDYFGDGFNQFDSFIVATSLFELVIASVSVPQAHAGGGFITVLRAGRLFRVFKLARAWTTLKKVLNTVASSMGSLLPLSIILVLFMFIYSLLGMQLYGGKFFFPTRSDCSSWQRYNNGCSIPRANFDEFVTAMVAIFQMMTGEDWNVVMYDGIAASSSGSFFYFMILVVFGNYIILNLFLAILLSGFEGNDGTDSEDEAEDDDGAAKSDGGIFAKLCACCTSSKVAPDDEGGDDKGLEKLHGAEGIKHLAESDRDENTIPDHNSLGCFSKTNAVRRFAFATVHHPVFENFILTLIIISSLALGYQNPRKHDGPNKEATDAIIMKWMDLIFLIIFTVEFSLKHIAFGVFAHPRAYWRDAWNIMDGFIVIVGYIGILAEDLPQLKPLRAIRTMRALRPLRALRRFPGMKLAVNCLLQSIPLMIPMGLVSLLFFLIFAILGLQLFSGSFWSCSFDVFESDTDQAEKTVQFLALLTGYKGTIGAGGGNSNPDPIIAVPVAECYGTYGTGAAAKDCEWTDTLFTQASCPTGCTYAKDAAKTEYLVQYVSGLGYSLREAGEGHNFGGDFLDPAKPLQELADVMIEFPYMQVPQLRNEAFKLLLGRTCACDEYAPRIMTQATVGNDTVVTCPTVCVDEDNKAVTVPASEGSGTALALDVYGGGTGAVPAWRYSWDSRANVGKGGRDPYAWDNDPDHANAADIPTAPGFDDFCTDENSFHGTQCSRAECRLAGGMWTQAMTHFDNIFEALLCLFEMSTTEGWPDVMWSGVDSTNVGQQPVMKSPGNSLGSTLFFVGFLVVGNFFVLNLFVGAVIDNYLDLEEAAKKDMELMTPEQKEWVETQKKMVGLQLRAKIPEPENPFRKGVYKMVQKTAFEIIVTLLIITNILVLAMKHRAMSSMFEEEFLFYSNWFFTVIFIFEMAAKLIAFGPKHYFQDTWNKFDFVLVLVSVLDKVLTLDGIGTFFRVFRVARIVRVARSASDLRRMFQTIIISIPALGNVGSLLFLNFFIYSILGVNFFHSACGVPPYFATLGQGAPNAQQGGFSLDDAAAMFDPCTDTDYGHDFDGFVSVNVAQNRDVFFALSADANTDGEITQAEWTAMVGPLGFDPDIQIAGQGGTPQLWPITVVEAASQTEIPNKASIKELFDAAVYCPTATTCKYETTRVLEALQKFSKGGGGGAIGGCCGSTAEVEVIDYVTRPSYVAAEYAWVKDYSLDVDSAWATKARPPIRCAELTLECGEFEDPEQRLLQELGGAATCYGIASCAAVADQSNDGAEDCAAGNFRPTCDLDDTTPSGLSAGDGLCPAGCASTAGFPQYAECTCENLNYNANFRSFGVAFLTLIRMATGEYWNGLQHDLTDNAGHTYAFAYFFTFLILATFIMLNLVVAVMIINYNEQQADSDRAVNQDHMDHFRDVWESFDPEGRGWMRTEKLPALLEKLDIPLGFHSSKPMAKVAQKKALQELAMQLPDHDGWIHYTETLFALAYRNQSEQAVEDLPEDMPRVDEIQAQKEMRVKEDGERGVMDPKPLQETMAVLSFQAVYRSYQERRNKGGEGSVDPLKRKLRPGQAALPSGAGGEAGVGPDRARPDADYRAPQP